MKQNFINESLKDLNNFKKILNEAYGEPMMPQGEEEMMAQGEEAMGEEPQQPQVDPRKMSNHERMENSLNATPMQETEEENPIANDGQMRNIIDQIRELAIQGIAQYSENICDERYLALKRIWLETDKFYESFLSDDKKKK